MALFKGKVIPIDINDEMRTSYLDYAMSVIVGRALPDVRDGLKPVHRRILYAMYNLGMTPDKPHRKSAHIVGQVMAKYHPHGDMAIYDTLVRLAQDFSCRYPLVDGHGNFGSIDGDSAAAMRYTEARMAKVTLEMLSDIDKDTVDFIPNYDGSDKEPTVLPAKLPSLLINGSSGIAVGMATNIPPHNLGEVIDALILLIKKPDTDVNRLMQIVKGPDFPTAGQIIGRDGIVSAYTTGRGSVKMRAVTAIEKLDYGKSAIVVTEIPYTVNKSKLIEKIAELSRDKKVDGITDLRDESDRRGMRIVIELRRDINPQVVLNLLYKHTQLQESFGIIMLALVDGVPRVLTLKQVLTYYLEHQVEVITRRSRFELDKATARAHIVEGLLTALDHIDKIINIIRASRTVEIARESLIAEFNLTEKQASAILEMRLQKLTGLERDKLIKEHAELLKSIEYLRSVLADKTKLNKIIIKELLEIKKKYNDTRRTVIIERNEPIIETEELIQKEHVVVTITNNGYLKKTLLTAYTKTGKNNITIKGPDFIKHMFIASTHHYFLLFTNKGKVYRLKVHEIPEVSKDSKGTALINLLYIDQGEKVTAVIPVPYFNKEMYLFMATQKGSVKKTELNQFDTSRRDGIQAITLDDGDELVEVKMTDGKQELILGTEKGFALRFSEEEITSHGRLAKGFKGIRLSDDDQVVSMDTLTDGAEIVVITSRGYLKRTKVSEYRPQSKGGKGIISINVTPKNGNVVALLVVRPGDQLICISNGGTSTKLKVEEIPIMGRATQGTRAFSLKDGDMIATVAKIVIENIDEVDDAKTAKKDLYEQGKLF